MTLLHRSVMTNEMLDYLQPQPGGFYVDGTLGAGGHTRAIAERCSSCRLLSIDRDPQALEFAAAALSSLSQQIQLVEGRYGDLAAILSASGFGRSVGGRLQVDGIVVDAGLSSRQLDDPTRGFSLTLSGPLDMRMSDRGETCADLLDRLSEAEVAEILVQGEVRGAHRLARIILTARRSGQLETTSDLARRVAGAVPREHQLQVTTLVFQALRIAVNRELEDLAQLCRQLPDLVSPGGVVVVISFHSLEDRIVKQAFQPAPPSPVLRGVPLRGKLNPTGDWHALTRRPVRPSEREVRENPRSRSARLRAARRLASPAAVNP